MSNNSERNRAREKERDELRARGVINPTAQVSKAQATLIHAEDGASPPAALCDFKLTQKRVYLAAPDSEHVNCDACKARLESERHFKHPAGQHIDDDGDVVEDRTPAKHLSVRGPFGADHRGAACDTRLSAANRLTSVPAEVTCEDCKAADAYLHAATALSTAQEARASATPRRDRMLHEITTLEQRYGGVKFDAEQLVTRCADELEGDAWAQARKFLLAAVAFQRELEAMGVAVRPASQLALRTNTARAATEFRANGTN
jgi:hypothetical protein